MNILGCSNYIIQNIEEIVKKLYNLNGEKVVGWKKKI